MEAESKVMAFHSVFGIIMGFIAYLISSVQQGFTTILIGFVFLLFLGNLTERFLTSREALGGIRGWLSNGALPYFFLWMITWIVLHNIYF